MSFEHLTTLLPCHSLDDFPIYAVGDEADGLLTAWTTPWHPALIAMAGRVPQWCRMDDLPVDTRDALLFLPGGRDQQNDENQENDEAGGLPDVVSQAVEDAGCVLIRDHVSRPECIRAALAAAGIDANLFADCETLARDFLALGYWYLQVQLLTRHMHYTTNLDDDRFAEALVKAAKRWQSGDQAGSREQLSTCYDILAQERDHYYPVEAYLIDLTLVADSTTPEELADEFKHESPVNIWLTARTLQRLANESPQFMDTLRKAIDQEHASVYGGEPDEPPLAYLYLEDVLSRLRSGNAVFESLLGSRVRHFGRRRFGVTPRLPQLLTQVGYHGAVHATLDDGRFPEGEQTRTRWAGLDETTLETIAGVPYDAALPETFLRLAMRMSESMESDFVATVCLAHWAGRSSPWYDDLRCGTRYGLALGRFATLERYFADTGYTGQLDHFSADRYRSPYLKQAVAAGEDNPVSRWSNYWRYQSAVRATRALRSWIGMLNPNEHAERESLLTPVQPTSEQIDDAMAGLNEAASAFVRLVVPADTDARPGKVSINPFSSARRSTIPLLGDDGKPVYASDVVDGAGQSLVDTPAHGISWVPAPDQRTDVANNSEQIARQTANPKTSETHFTLRNEFCEVRIDPRSGGVLALNDFHSRGNRLSQQLGLRQPVVRRPPGHVVRAADQRCRYATMTADRCEITSNSVLSGQVTATGVLRDEDRTVAEFEQITRLQLGSRLVELCLRIDPCVELTDDPWNSYFACRFAWNNEASLIYRDVNQSRQLTAAQRIESPLFVEIDDVNRRTAILTGGLPYHRRVDRRQLDTILITKGESQTKFRIAVGVDCRSVVADAWSLLLPSLVVDHRVPPKAGSHWLFHLNARHVIATDWSPRVEMIENDNQQVPSCVGFTVRLLETLGRDGEIMLRSFRPIQSATRQNFLGQKQAECQVVDGAARIKIKADEWTQIEVNW